ncbi:hypothetical protein BYT27DRAFT_7296908 [Phlegmacium glaucopus]|nr:hypothetical protein BYT27DRAFT_7296908 [Phlegmacium glaucopus]
MTYCNKDILDRDRFWKEELLKATQDRLFGCYFDGLNISRKNELLVERPNVNGLIGGHAYSILRVKECKGAWGDGSKEWVGKWLDVLKELDHVFGNDGEFVMEYTFKLIERTTIFNSSWVMSSHWLWVPPQGPNTPWTFGDLSFKFTLSKPSFTIIALLQPDTRYFEDISGVSKWNIDFVVYKRGNKEITGASFYAIVMARSVTCELNLEAGEYIIFGYFEAQARSWDQRKLTRVLTERAKAWSIAVNLNEGANDTYFARPIETLIKVDLEKLVSEKQKVVKDNDNEDSKEEEEGEKEEEAEKDTDDLKKTEGDPEKGEPAVPEFLGLVPGSEMSEGYILYEDLDLIIVGVRIYTKGRAVVSVTGQVFNEQIDDKKEDKGS